MGKYLAVIKTAECGSLTRAAQAMGYTQPSLGYIINNIEDELQVKLFYRDQRGMTLTETGRQLLEIMQQIETMEERLFQTARVRNGELLRVGIFPSTASQWLPAILEDFYRAYPGAMVKLVHQFYFLDGETSVKSHSLDCCFFTGRRPSGLDALPLYEDPYHLVVPADSPLAEQEEVSVWDVAGHVPFLPNNESFDPGCAIWDVYQAFEKVKRLDCQPQENQMTIAMVEQGLGVTLLTELCLSDLLPGRRVALVRPKEDLKRPVSLLCPRETERSTMLSGFVRIAQRVAASWAAARQGGA